MIFFLNCLHKKPVGISFDPALLRSQSHAMQHLWLLGPQDIKLCLTIFSQKNKKHETCDKSGMICLETLFWGYMVIYGDMIFSNSLPYHQQIFF